MLLAVAGCVAAPPAPEVERITTTAESSKPADPHHVGPLEGVWRQKGFSCREGQVTPTDHALIEALQSGHMQSLLRVEGELAVFDVKQYHDLSRKGDYCRWISQEKWLFVEPHSIKMSDMKTNQHGYGTIHCRGSTQLPDERIYGFELKGRELRLVAPLSTHSSCIGGQPIMVLERLL
jgi:hypothetical protein